MVKDDDWSTEGTAHTIRYGGSVLQWNVVIVGFPYSAPVEDTENEHSPVVSMIYLLSWRRKIKSYEHGRLICVLILSHYQYMRDLQRGSENL